MDKTIVVWIKNVKNVMSLIGFLIMLLIIEAYITPMNPESWLENWSIGVIGIVIFSILYCIPPIKLLFKPKKIYFFMIMISICFIIIDWTDFILFMRGS